jgi:choline kinase
VTDFGKHLDPARSYGESIGIERVSGVAVSSLFHGLRQAREEGQTGLYYEDVYARLVRAGLAATAVDVSDLPWTEVDTPEDLAAARALVARGGLDSAGLGRPEGCA